MHRVSCCTVDTYASYHRSVLLRVVCTRRLANEGPACVSCHSVKGIGVLAGPTSRAVARTRFADPVEAWESMVNDEPADLRRLGGLPFVIALGLLYDSAVKTLYILRHAKSDWGSPAESDHERPLNKRGQKAAKVMGRFLAASGQVPGAVISSSAVRARTTAELVVSAGGFESPLRVTRQFYESRPGAVLDEVRSAPDEHPSLLLAGHEPTSSGLVELLTGAQVKMVTAAIARVDLGAEHWVDVEPKSGILVWFVTPKLLQATGWVPE